MIKLSDQCNIAKDSSDTSAALGCQRFKSIYELDHKVYSL